MGNSASGDGTGGTPPLQAPSSVLVAASSWLSPPDRTAAAGGSRVVASSRTDEGERRDRLERLRGWEECGGLLDRAEAWAEEMEEAGDPRAGWLTQNRARVALATREAEARVNHHFDRIAGHRKALQRALEHARKAEHRMIADADSLAHALASICRASQCHRRVALDDVVGCLDACDFLSARKRRLLLLAFVHSSTDLRAWRERCEVVVAGKDDEWEALETQPVQAADMCSARYHTAGAAIGESGAVFVVGGCRNGRKLGSCEFYSLSRDCWTELPQPLPTPRSHCGACAVGNNTLVVVGGEDEQGDSSTAAEAFDCAAGTWRTLPPLPVATRGCAVVGWGGKVFVCGGFARGMPSSQAWVLDAQRSDPRWSPLPRMLMARGWPGGAAGMGCVFVCGGSLAHAPCEAYSVILGRWCALPPTPARLYGCACCFGGGNLFVVGGLDGSKALRTVFVFDLAQRAWTELARMHEPRRGCGAVCVGRHLVVFGGWDGTKSLASCEKYDF